MSTTNNTSLNHLFRALEEAGLGLVLEAVFTDPNKVPMDIRTAIKDLGNRLFDIREYEAKAELAGLPAREGVR